MTGRFGFRARAVPSIRCPGRALLLALVPLAMAQTAGAGDGKGTTSRSADPWYVEGIGTHSWPQTDSFSDPALPPGTEGSLSFRADYGIGVAGGYRVRPDVRVELEGMMRQLDNHFLNNGGFGTGGSQILNGDATLVSMMANAYYDAEPLRVWRIVPYVGAGMGPTVLDIDSEDIALEKRKPVLGYQGAAGVTVDVQDGIYLRFGYKYFGTTGAEVRGSSKLDMRTHNAEGRLGLRF